jgi:hypothetical protein
MNWSEEFNRIPARTLSRLRVCLDREKLRGCTTNSLTEKFVIRNTPW